MGGGPNCQTNRNVMSGSCDSISSRRIRQIYILWWLRAGDGVDWDGHRQPLSRGSTAEEDPEPSHDYGVGSVNNLHRSHDDFPSGVRSVLVPASPDPRVSRSPSSGPWGSTHDGFYTEIPIQSSGLLTYTPLIECRNLAA